MAEWTKDALRDGTTIYRLNANGTNMWIASVQRGFADNGFSLTNDQCLEVAKEIHAALSDPAALMREVRAFVRAVNFAFTNAGQPGSAIEDGPFADMVRNDGRALLSKLEGK
jgi:hypothetical protein